MNFTLLSRKLLALFGLILIGHFSNAQDACFDPDLEHYIAKSPSNDYISMDDLDSDGDIDYVYIDTEDGKIAWKRNDGNQNFSEEIVLFENYGALGPDIIATGDIDNDGDIDIITDQASTGSIFWGENTGSGYFAFYHPITTSAPMGFGDPNIVMTDMNGDGILDILLSKNDNVVWLENAGDTPIWPEHIVDVAPSTFTRAIRAFDLDQDGDDDIITSFGNQARLSWYENDGLGIFGPEIVLDMSNSWINAFDLGDMDGDGDIDIVATNHSDDELWILENDGAQSFSYDTFLGDDWYVSPRVADLNNDGLNDIVVGKIKSQAIYPTTDASQTHVLFNLGGNSFSNALEFGMFRNYSQMEFIDIDDDGDLDIFTSQSDSTAVEWLENYNFVNFIEHDLSLPRNDRALDITHADVDGDGDYDVLVADNFNDQVSWYENDGTGTFLSQYIIEDQLPNVQTMSAVDIDNDGDIDVAVANHLPSTCQMRWYMNTGSGNFNVGSTIYISTLYGFFDIEFGDLDNDGDLDLVGADDGSWDVKWFENNGSGNFGTEQFVTSVLYEPRSVALADIDSDGDMDVIAVSYSTDVLVIYENLGGGNFATGMNVTSTIVEPIKVYAEDIDNDSFVDLIVISDSGISCYSNDGTGIFNSEVIIASFNKYSDLAFADYNMDGTVDISCYTRSTSSLSNVYLLENQGGGFFLPPYTINSEFRHGEAMGSADLDGDGDSDIILGDWHQEKLSWLENFCGDPIIVEGCTNPEACNFNADANTDDGSCASFDCLGECGGPVVEGTPCDDANAQTINDVYDDICHCSGELVSDVSEIRSDDFLSLYPIPANNILYLETSLQEDLRFYILDLSGKILTEPRVENAWIDISELASGVYFLKVVTENGSVVKKFIKE